MYTIVRGTFGNVMSPRKWLSMMTVNLARRRLSPRFFGVAHSTAILHERLRILMRTGLCTRCILFMG